MTESNATENRKALLYRRANGKRVLAVYLRKIAALFSEARQEDLLPLDVTEAILANFNQAKIALRETRTRLAPPEVYLFLSEAIKVYQDGFYAFIDEEWRYCGAISFGTPQSISPNFEFCDAILNDLVFIDHEMSSAMSLDFFEMEGRTLVDVMQWRK